MLNGKAIIKLLFINEEEKKGAVNIEAIAIETINQRRFRLGLNKPVTNSTTMIIGSMTTDETKIAMPPKIITETKIAEKIDAFTL